MNTPSDTSIFDSDDLRELEDDLRELDTALLELELDDEPDSFECKGCLTTYSLESSLMRHLRQKAKCRKLHRKASGQPSSRPSSPMKADQSARSKKNDDVVRRRDASPAPSRQGSTSTGMPTRRQR